MLADAHLRGKVQLVPKLPQQMKLQNTKDRVLSPAEQELFCRYFNAIGQPAAADVFVFLIESCARWGELENLKGEDVDLAKGRVTFSKTKANRVRTIPLTKRAIEALQGHMPAVGSHKVFPYRYWQFLRMFEAAKAAAGLVDDTALTIHTTRHTCASKLAASGIPLHQLMAFGGWTSLASVQRYLHLHTDALSACVAALEG
jgi:integrase